MPDTSQEVYWIKMFGESKAQVIENHFLCVHQKKPSRLQEAYDKAHEVRQFEINLYWKRALYFWGFEAAFMLAFGTVLEKGNQVSGQFYYLFLLALFAFCFTLLWRLALKGAKRWQENWEAHIDMLEECFSGNLYKTVLYKASLYEKGRIRDFFSVSKVNEAINKLLLIMWFVMGAVSWGKAMEASFSLAQSNNIGWFQYTAPSLIFISAYALALWLADKKLKSDLTSTSACFFISSRPDPTVKQPER
jgi:hypothetical protein